MNSTEFSFSLSQDLGGREGNILLTIVFIWFKAAFSFYMLHKSGTSFHKTAELQDPLNQGSV